MKKIALVLSVCLVACLAGSVLASEKETVTLNGRIMCAKCALHEEGRTQCQNVLVVEDQKDEQYYYLVKNAINEEFGEVCTAKVPVEVTGQLSEKDGKQWIAAEKIRNIEDKG